MASFDDEKVEKTTEEGNESSVIKWKKKNGTEIVTNSFPATVKKAKELAWEEVK